MNYREVIEAYEDVRPRYEELTSTVERELHQLLKDACIPHRCESRTKDVASFVKTALKKGLDDPLTQIKDKSGVRVLIPYEDLEDLVADQVRSHFRIVNEDDKRKKLGTERFTYSALHLQVSLLSGEDDVMPPSIENLECEIQIHTYALNAWSEVSHDLIYKPLGIVDDEYVRKMNRLIALAEVFDAEVGHTRRELEATDDFSELKMLQIAEELYLPLAKRGYDRELSLLAMTVLVHAYDGIEISVLRRLVGDELASRRSELEAIFAHYSMAPLENPFLYQPESLIIYERLRTRPQKLREAWERGPLPLNVLEDLAAIFGEIV